MRLNLGCGRAQLPTTKDNPFTKHLMFLPETALDQNERWTNIDRVAIDGVDEVIDLFAYPWVRSSNGNPWNENTVDEIWASHLVEHIPHTARYAPCATTMHQTQGALDGWYAWFYEAWRILKPDGLLHIVSPTAFSNEGMIDPSHTRYILPSSFSYLSPNQDAPFDYQIASHFEAVDNVLVRYSDAWNSMIDAKMVNAEQAHIYSSIHNNLLIEMYICLRAIKDE